MRWTKSRDGKMRVNIRAQWRLDRQELAEILAARAHSRACWQDGDLTVTQVIMQIHHELAENGMSRWPYWREGDDADEADEITEWARRQVARI